MWLLMCLCIVQMIQGLYQLIRHQHAYIACDLAKTHAAPHFNEYIYIEQLLAVCKEGQLLCFPLQKGLNLIKIHND